MGNGKLIISVRRHEKRDKPGESITEESFQRAVCYGGILRKELEGYQPLAWHESGASGTITPPAAGFHSASIRTIETLDGIFRGLSGDLTERGLIEKDIAHMYVEMGYKSPFGMGSLFFKNSKKSDLLNEIEFDKNPGYQAERKKQPSDYDSQINFLLQHPDDSGKTETMEQSGKRIVQHIEYVCQNFKVKADKNKQGKVFYVENVSHGPLVEAALIALVDPTIKDIKYLHGGFREGENFRIEIGEHKKLLYFKGECCDISKRL